MDWLFCLFLGLGHFSLLCVFVCLFLICGIVLSHIFAFSLQNLNSWVLSVFIRSACLSTDKWSSVSRKRWSYRKRNNRKTGSFLLRWSEQGFIFFCSLIFEILWKRCRQWDHSNFILLLLLLLLIVQSFPFFYFDAS